MSTNRTTRLDGPTAHAGWPPALSDQRSDTAGRPGDDARSRLALLLGTWREEVHLPGVPAGRTSFRWALGQQFLLQHSAIADPAFPDSLGVISAVDGGYIQHYFDSRGVVRTYAMSFDGRTWTLLRDRPDFTPLSFAQRFTGTLSPDGDTIAAAWERSDDGEHWQTDFTLTYTRVRLDQVGADDSLLGGTDGTDLP